MKNLIMFFDTETTALPLWDKPSESEGQPHIVDLCAMLVDEDTRELLELYQAYVRPDGFDIYPEAASVHGLTREFLLDAGISEKEAVSNLLELWKRCNIRVGHSVSMDNRVIRIATKRFFDTETQDLWKAGESACTGFLARPIMKMDNNGKRGFKLPKLIEAYEFFTGKPAEGAHTSLGDAKMTMDVYFSIKDLEK